MSNFYAKIKHKLVETTSPDYQEILKGDEFLSVCASTAKAMVKDTGFKMIGFADLHIKRYFLLVKLGRCGDLLEIPVSTEFLDMYLHAKGADLQKQRMKKALKREDMMKFSIELKKFADSQTAEIEMTVM